MLIPWVAVCCAATVFAPAATQTDRPGQSFGSPLQEIGRLGIGPSMAARVAGDRLYVIGRGRLFIAELPEPKAAEPRPTAEDQPLRRSEQPAQRQGAAPIPIVVGRLSGLGNTRQLAVEGSVAYVASREDGVFLVDVSNPAAPKLLSRYDAVELATGIDVVGNVMFVACRLHGLELVDVSNPRQPKHLSTARTGETQSVAVCNGYAYAGVWGTSELVVVDVRNARRPIITARVPLDGYGDGVAVCGSYVYVATGHHNRQPHRKEGDPGFGHGHGLEVFDASAPARPKFLARVKMPPFYRIGNDMWSVKVAGRYAFVADTYNGVFIVDVSNPHEPRFAAHWQLPVLSGNKLPGFAGGLAVGRDCIYVAGGDTDLHVVAAPGMARPVKRDAGRPPIVRAAYSDPDEQLRVYRPDGQVHAAAPLPHSDLVAVAAGSAGLHLVRIAGDQLVRVAQYAARGFATDVAACGPMLYLAEAGGGLSVWHHREGGKLELVGRYEVPGLPVRSVIVPSPGHFALVQVGMSALDVVDVRNPEHPKRVFRDKGHGFLYDLCPNYAPEPNHRLLLPVLWQLGGVRWYDIQSDRPRLSTCAYPYRLGSGGLVLAGERTLAVYGGGYLLLECGEKRPPSQMPVYRPAGNRVGGKPTLVGNHLYLAHRAQGRIGHLDVSDLKRPRLLQSLTLPGNPGRLVVRDSTLLVPDGYDGLRYLKLSERGCWPATEGAEYRFRQRTKRLCQQYIEAFGSPATQLVYHHRLNGPQGLAALVDPKQVAARTVDGRPMPYGYGSGIQDVALENGQLLFALCDAYDATGDEYFAHTARWIFQGFKRIATVSPEPGFVPRGPHPDGKSYYPDSSRDQHAAFVEALWRYSRSRLAGEDDRRFIARQLQQVAQRMERNDWKIMVEDGSHMAHVGFGWRQYTSIGAISLLSFLAMVYDATGDPHWKELYERFSEEKDGIRWRRFLHPDAVSRWKPLTLYSNQFAQALEGLRRAESDPRRSAQIGELLHRLARRALESNVFDTQRYRRLDWAGNWDQQQTARQLARLGLSLDRPTTVVDLYRWFDPAMWQTGPTELRSLSGKLCFGLPTVAFHTALLSDREELIRQVEPHVEDMVEVMLQYGRYYHRGENFNRTVVLALELVAARAAEQD